MEMVFLWAAQVAAEGGEDGIPINSDTHAHYSYQLSHHQYSCKDKRLH
uniref:Uncharacterized protein n=1 Tax=Rhizophora mucronata TaxID=61149 RepID=A0A2P2QFL7_RHIMU